MTRRFRFCLCPAVLLLLFVPSAGAQSAPPPSSRAEERAREQQDKAKHTHPYVPTFFERQARRFDGSGRLGVVKGIGVTFGGIKPGSGFAVGPALGYTFPDGGFVHAKAVYSIRNYKLLQARYQARPFLDGRLIVNGRVRWHDAPNGPVSPVGPGAPDLRADYDEQRTEVSGQAAAEPLRFVRLGAGAGWEKYSTDGGPILLFGQPPLVRPLPGLNADPKYVHTYGTAAFDSRESQGYSRSGTLLQATVHDFRARQGAPYSFRRVDGDAQQLIPIMQGNMVFDLSAHVWSTSPGDDDDVPFFLMPTLGGSTFLRGFRNYRFRDRNAMLLAAQYRWYVQEYVEGVLFYEAGKVAPRFGDLDLGGLEKSYGIGFHFHSPRTIVLRLELARSREGVRFIFGFSPILF
jgi:surface antigen Omp85-like protein